MRNGFEMKRLVAEFLGTFTLVFAGAGAIVIDEASGGTIGHVGISIVFGLVVLSMIHAFGDVSGAHFNPAVTLAFAVAGRFPWRGVGGFAAAQFAGALMASLSLKALFPASATLGATLPSGPLWQSFILEIILTTILVVVVLNVSTGSKERGITAAIAIGAVVAFEAMFAGPVSGASMNPVRSLGPAMVSGCLEHAWLYPVAAVFGAIVAVPICRSVREAGCCGGTCS